MNIWALEGHKVKVTENTINCGYESDSDEVKANCELEKEYTVDYTVVHSSSTDVYLKEFPNISFNSVNFEDVKEQDEEMDKEHEDWARYNR